MGISEGAQPEVVGGRLGRQLNRVAADRLVGCLAVYGERSAGRRGIADFVVAAIPGVGDGRPGEDIMDGEIWTRKRPKIR